MDPQASPPKRMTRARAAKVGEGSTAAKTTKIVTASAKAKAARSTATSSAKRKTRADEVEEYEDQDQEDELAQPEPTTKTRTRGRPKQKAADAPPEVEAAPATRTRGRPKKTAEPSKEEPQPAKAATRTTRTKKTTQSEAEAPAEPAKKRATRTRGSATAPTKSTAAKSATAKKTVKFEEPEKENIEPAPSKTTRGKAAETATTGLRAKPVRRAPASTTTARASTRAGVGAAKTSGQESKYEKPTPLSPKKVTQMAMHNRATAAESEDELAADEKTTAKPRATKAMSGVRVRGGVKLQAPRPAPKPTSDEDDMENEVALPTVILGSPCRRPPPSPWKDSLKTPARRVDGVPSLAQSAARPPSRLFDDEAGQQRQQPQSAFKTSLFASPAKRPQSAIKGLDLRTAGGLQLGAPSPFRTSMLSPPKRPASPNKPSFLGFGSPRKQQEDETAFGRTPATKSTLLATPLAAEPPVGESQPAEEDAIPEDVEEEDDEEEKREPNRLLFPGRMSAVLPRHADPALDPEELNHERENEEQADDCVDLVADDNQEAEEHVDDPMHLDGPNSTTEHVMARSEREATTTPPASPPKQHPAGFFGLREKDLNPAQGQDTESESEDELATTETVPPATPCPATSRSTGSGNAMSARSANFGERSTVKRARTDSRFGFTPLASKLSTWGTSSSPLKIGRPESPGIDILGQEDETTATVPPKRTPADASPMRNDYFDEAVAQTEVVPQDDAATADVAEEHDDEKQIAPEPMETEDDSVLTPEFDDIPATEEDMSLAAEANEMSLMEPGQVEEMLHSDAQSDASQEYGDENAVPIDPTLLVVPPVTPQRDFEVRHVHTVSKVPTKPAADDSTPRPRVKRRGHSISRLPVLQQQRPTQGLQRNATVISYSPTKRSATAPTLEVSADAEERGESAPPAPVTPAKSEWSMAGTPARTPRRDLNPALLGGAVVFVDVHTSEGADASGIFVELLAQMGARCVKAWSWNPASPQSSSQQATDGAAASSRIGITHVVYKDGGKRTLEKVRESGGVVQCVGVSWVLE